MQPRSSNDNGRVYQGYIGLIFYLDDVLFAQDEQECYRRVLKVLNKFKKANIKVRQENVTFLLIKYRIYTLKYQHRG